ncbi:hypothetical protein Tco_0664054 [Tanacetum coccineum]
MPKSINYKKDNKSFKRTTRISICACCFVNPPLAFLPNQHFSPPTDYQTEPPSTPFESPPTSPSEPPGFSLDQLLTTPKTTPPPLTSPPLALSQPSKQNSPLDINLETWRERFMNYLEEKTDGEAMINSIQNGDHPLPVVTQVSLAGTAPNAPPTLKDPKFWTSEEKKTRKINRFARSLLIQGLPNEIYSLIDSNDTAKDL